MVTATTLFELTKVLYLQTNIYKLFHRCRTFFRDKHLKSMTTMNSSTERPCSAANSNVSDRITLMNSFWRQEAPLLARSAPVSTLPPQSPAERHAKLLQIIEEALEILDSFDDEDDPEITSLSTTAQ